jgi:hypothetical protein
MLDSARKCRMRIAHGWDETTKTFEHTAPCLCPGLRKPATGECPHEYTKQAPACVHCGHMKVAGEKRVT